MRWLLIVVLAAGCDPTLAPSLPAVIEWKAHAFSASDDHTLLVTPLGDVETDGVPVPLPDNQEGETVKLVLPPVLDVAAGSKHACALEAGGAVYCWGDHAHGALGFKRTCTTEVDGTPSCLLNAAVMSMPPMRALAAGTDVTCGIATDDRVYCWGSLGPWLGGTTWPPMAMPTPVLLAEATPLRAWRLVVHDTTACAIDHEGAAWCWGDRHGATPVRLELEGVVDLAFSRRHTCAITASGLSCWGENRNGESGDLEAARACGKDCTVDLVRIALDATRVVVGERHSCALSRIGEVWCWGSNEVGQLGRTDSFLLGGIGLALTGAIDLAAGDAHTCALGPLGTVWCWGEHHAIEVD